MKYNEDGYAICPFYKKHTTMSIFCESLISSETSDATFLGMHGECLEYRRTYCREFYKSCPKYQALSKKYADKDERQQIINKFKFDKSLKKPTD